MTYRPQTFASRRSIETMEKIAAFASGRRFTSHDLRELTGLSAGQVGNYLKQMDKLNRIHCVEPQVVCGRLSIPAVWSGGPAPAVPLLNVDHSIVDDFPRRVIVRSSWTPNHVRMPMECLLFGVPKVLQGVAIC